MTLIYPAAFYKNTAALSVHSHHTEEERFIFPYKSIYSFSLHEHFRLHSLKSKADHTTYDNDEILRKNRKKEKDKKEKEKKEGKK